MYEGSSPIDRFVASIQPRIQDALSGVGHEHAEPPGLLHDTIEELQVAVEELRVSQEELISARMEVEEARRSGELGAAWYRELFAASPDALLVTDGLGTVHDANRAAGALLRVQPDAMRGKPLAVFVCENHRRAFRRLLSGVRDLVGTHRADLRVQPRGAPALEAEVAVTPLASPGGAVLLWSVRDMTARRAHDASRDDEAETVRAALRSLPAAVAVMDLDGTVLAWNAAAERLLGWSEDEVAGRPNPAIPGEMRHRVDEARAGGSGKGVTWLRATAATPAGRAVEVEVVLAPLIAPGGEARGTVALMAPLGEASVPDEAPAPTGAEAAAARPREPMEPARLLGSGSGELLERLRAGVAAGLHLGHVRPGDRLPSIREVARAAGADHRVVSAAYRQLASEGMVQVVNRRGATVAPLPAGAEVALAESAEWLAGVLAQAWLLQVKAPQLPEMVREWTCAAPVRCACVESTEDDLAALTQELAAQWGLETYPVRVELRPADPAAARRALAEALRGADLAVTTAFHARAVEAAVGALGVPVVVAPMSPAVVEAMEERLRGGPLTAVVADERWGERLRALPGGERVRVVRADDAAAVAALDPAEPVLLTRAARERIGAARPRLLVPPSHFVSPACGEEVARVLIRRNVRAARSPG